MPRLEMLTATCQIIVARYNDRIPGDEKYDHRGSWSVTYSGTSRNMPYTRPYSEVVEAGKLGKCILL